MFKKFLKRQTGSAELIAVLVTASIGLVVLTSNMQMITNMQKENRAQREQAGSKDLATELEVFLSLPQNCAANFSGDTANGADQTADLVNLGNTPIFDVGSLVTYNSGLFKITKWSLNDSAAVLDPGPPERRIVDLEIHLEKVSDSIGPKEVIRTVKLVTVKAGGAGAAINTCFALVGKGTDIWVRSATGDHIFNTNFGNVGIGLETGTQKLHVVGNAIVEGVPATGGVLTTGGLTSVDDVTIGGTTAAIGGLAIGKTSLNSTLDVVGNAFVDGNVTVRGSTGPTSGTTTVNSMSATGNVTVPGTMTVIGGSNFTTSSYGPYVSTSTSTFQGMATFNSSVMMQSTLSVNGATGSTLSVGGDASMVGNLTANRISATTALCLSGNCRTTFAQQDCPNGMIRDQFADGTVACITPTCSALGSYYVGHNGGTQCTVLPSKSCPVGQYIHIADPLTGTPSCRTIPPEVQVPACTGTDLMVGVSNGNAICRPPTVTGGVCPNNQVAYGLNADGSPRCRTPSTAYMCPPGQVVGNTNLDGSIDCVNVTTATNCLGNQIVVGINPDGTPRCGAFTIQGVSCTGGQVVTGVNANGTLTCGTIASQVICTVNGTSSTGLGAPATPAGCFCNNAGEVWNGSSCVYVPACTPGVTSQYGAGGPASPTGCFCINAGETWNGSTCSTSSTPPGCTTWQMRHNCVGGVQVATPPATGSYCERYSGTTSMSGSGPQILIWAPSSSTQYNAALPMTTMARVCTNCPAGTSTSGSGAAASPAGCYCNNAGETWNGSACVAPVSCPAGTSTSGAGGVASPASCKCNGSNEFWNGSACVTSSGSTCNWVRTASNSLKDTSNIASTADAKQRQYLALLDFFAGKVPAADACTINCDSPSWMQIMTPGEWGGTITGVALNSHFGGTPAPAPPMGSTISPPDYVCDTSIAGAQLAGVDHNSCTCGNLRIATFTCQCQGPVCPSGTSTSGAGGPASPLGCSCNGANETWNGSACVVNSSSGTCSGNFAVCGPGKCNGNASGSLTAMAQTSFGTGPEADGNCQGTAVSNGVSIPFNLTCNAASGSTVCVNQGTYASSGQSVDVDIDLDTGGVSGGTALYTCTVSCNAPSCPAGTSTTGAGAASSVAGCQCINSGETWNGSSCVAPTSCPAGTSTTGGGGPTGTGCFCDLANYSWNGSSCQPVCPAGTSTGGAGGDANPAACKCNNSGETWNGSSCVASGGGCTGGASLTGTGQNASPAGCRCPSNQPYWNGSACFTCWYGAPATWDAGNNSVMCIDGGPAGYANAGQGGSAFSMYCQDKMGGGISNCSGHQDWLCSAEYGLVVLDESCDGAGQSCTACASSSAVQAAPYQATAAECGGMKFTSMQSCQVFGGYRGSCGNCDGTGGPGLGGGGSCPAGTVATPPIFPDATSCEAAGPQTCGLGNWSGQCDGSFAACCGGGGFGGVQTCGGTFNTSICNADGDLLGTNSSAQCCPGSQGGYTGGTARCDLYGNGTYGVQIQCGSGLGTPFWGPWDGPGAY